MYKSKFLMGLVLLFYILFSVFQFAGKDFLALVFSALILPLITLLYFVTVKKKTLFFTLFLIFYSFSELMVFIESMIPYSLYYYAGNSLCIFAYAFLLIEICKSVFILHVLKNFKLHIVVLGALSFYIAYILQKIVNPYLEITYEYLIEVSYNIIMLLLLSVSLLNYFYKENRKALFLFFGALCIVFCEVINVAYLYVSDINLLNFLSETFLVAAFYFFYQQSKLDNKKKDSVEEMLIE